MSAVLDPHGHAHGDHAHDDHHEHHAPTGWRRWVFATNHKDIGTLYLLFAFTMFLIGGTLALLIRLELFQPGLQYFNPELFNQFTTMHGLIMVFGAIMPAWQGKLSETDIAAAITYTKNSWSNHTGVLVEPSDVVADEAK